jgi:hypothetical protein
MSLKVSNKCFVDGKLGTNLEGAMLARAIRLGVCNLLPSITPQHPG